MIINLQVEGSKKNYPNRYCALTQAKKLQKEGKEVNFPCALTIKKVNGNKVITVALEDGREIGSIYNPKYIDLNEYEKELRAIYREIYKDLPKAELDEDIYYKLKYKENDNKRYLENKEIFDFLNNILVNDKMPNYTAYIYGYDLYDITDNLTYSLHVEFK